MFAFGAGAVCLVARAECGSDRLASEVYELSCVRLPRCEWGAAQVQRIPRYRLLLQELYGCTPMQHGRAAIQAALDKVTVSADHVNAMLRQVQDSVESAKVFERFKACGAVMPNNPNRKLVRQSC